MIAVINTIHKIKTHVMREKLMYALFMGKSYYDQGWRVLKYKK